MLLTSDLRHAGFTPARATCCQGTPLRLSPRFPLVLSPAPFSSILSPCWGHPKLSSCSGLEWAKSVEILLFGLVLVWFFCWGFCGVFWLFWFFLCFVVFGFIFCEMRFLLTGHLILSISPAGPLTPSPDPSSAQLHKDVSEVARTASPRGLVWP